MVCADTEASILAGREPKGFPWKSTSGPRRIATTTPRRLPVIRGSISSTSNGAVSARFMLTPLLVDRYLRLAFEHQITARLRDDLTGALNFDVFAFDEDAAVLLHDDARIAS